MTSRVIRALAERLQITQESLAQQLGVSRTTVALWSQPDGIQPAKYRWKRIRELWKLSQWARTEHFWRDRYIPPRFDE